MIFLFLNDGAGALPSCCGDGSREFRRLVLLLPALARLLARENDAPVRLRRARCGNRRRRTRAPDVARFERPRPAPPLLRLASATPREGVNGDIPPKDAARERRCVRASRGGAAPLGSPGPPPRGSARGGRRQARPRPQSPQSRASGTRARAGLTRTAPQAEA